MFALRHLETMEGLRHFLTPYRRLVFSRLGKFGSEFLRHDLLQLLRVHSVAFGCAHKNVVTVTCGSLIGRIQQRNLQKQLAKVGLVIRADLLYQQFVRRRGVFLDLHLSAALPASGLGCRTDARLSSELQLAGRPSSTEQKPVARRLLVCDDVS